MTANGRSRDEAHRNHVTPTKERIISQVKLAESTACFNHPSGQPVEESN
jgi:hypothetical protein